MFFDEDGDVAGDTDGDGVAGARVDGDELAVGRADVENSEEGVLDEVVDADRFERAAQCADDVGQQVVRLRALDGDALEAAFDRLQEEYDKKAARVKLVQDELAAATTVVVGAGGERRAIGGLTRSAGGMGSTRSRIDCRLQCQGKGFAGY